MCEFIVQKEHSPGSCAWLEHDAFLFCAAVEEERQEIVTLSVRAAVPALGAPWLPCGPYQHGQGSPPRQPPGGHGGVSPGMRGRIHLLDFLPPNAYRDLLRVSSLHLCKDISFMLPSELLEAMSCGCVVLAPDTGAVREVLRDGLNGFLYPSGRRMNWAMLITLLLEKRAGLIPIRRNARKAVLGKHNKNTLLPRHIAFLMERYAHWRARQAQPAEGKDALKPASA